MMYVYQYVHVSGSRYTWTVGYFNSGGQWIPKSDYKTQDEAEREVERLNKQNSNRVIDEMMEFLKMVGYNEACYDKKYRKFWLEHKEEIIKFIDKSTEYYLQEVYHVNKSSEV